MNKTRILIADDHSIVRMGLTSLLNSHRDFTVVGEAENGEIAVSAARKLHPDIVIMDLMMPRKDGASATVEILSAHPEIKILILTTFGSFNGVTKALEAGAVGAVLKSADNDVLIAALKSIVNGKKVIAPEIKRLMTEDPPAPALTERQVTILRMVVRGFTNADISNSLNIREDSVKKLVHATFEKIGAANRAEAVSIVHRKNLLGNLPIPVGMP